MLQVFKEFERQPDLLAKFDKVLACYSATAVFPLPVGAETTTL